MVSEEPMRSDYSGWWRSYSATRTQRGTG